MKRGPKHWFATVINAIGGADATAHVQVFGDPFQRHGGLGAQATGSSGARGATRPTVFRLCAAWVMRPVWTHSATKMLPSASKQASCGWRNLPETHTTNRARPYCLPLNA